MSEEDNGTTPEPTGLIITDRLLTEEEIRKRRSDMRPPEQPHQGQAMQLGVQITPQGVVLSFPMGLSLDNETMGQLVRAYLAAHPELVQEIAREALAQKQQELSIIQLVRRSRNE
jgi:hypothetical protein